MVGNGLGDVLSGDAVFDVCCVRPRYWGPLLVSHRGQCVEPLTPDHVNGGFELVGGLLTWLSVRRLVIDKQVKGISWWPILFFTAWGLWNLFYYPYLLQWWSFIGGLFIVVANTVWLVLLVYYGRRK